MIIVLTGEKLSGKGTTAAYLQKHYAAKVYRCSETLDSILQLVQQPRTRSNLVALGVALRKIFGSDVLAKGIQQRIIADQPTLAVIDGVRYVEEWQVLQQLTSCQLWYITATVEQRYQRLRGRREKLDEQTMSWEEFVQREHDATENGIALLKQQAHRHLTNNASFEELYQQICAAVAI